MGVDSSLFLVTMLSGPMWRSYVTWAYLLAQLFFLCLLYYSTLYQAHGTTPLRIHGNEDIQSILHLFPNHSLCFA